MFTEIRTEVAMEEYCLFERESKTRHQYINAEILPMPYTSEKHGLIASHLAVNLGICLKPRKEYRLYIADRMLYVPTGDEIGNVYYPDLMIVAGEPAFKALSANMQATLNPVVLIEVLSGSNADNDLVEKLIRYKQIASLQQYVIFWQTKRQAEVFTRLHENQWLDVTVTAGDGAVQVLDCTLPFDDLYEHVC